MNQIDVSGDESDICAACGHLDTAHDSEAFSIEGDPVSCECGCPDFVNEADDEPE